MSSIIPIRRALFTVSNKDRIEELGKVFAKKNVEIVATGRTATVLKDAGLEVVPIEKVSGSPEAFQGRMKTLSFPVCSGILYRRGNAQDEKDLEALKIKPIDCVVVNFYPFEETVKKNLPRPDLIEQIDIGGPTLVRAAAKNAPDVLVLTHPEQYTQVIQEIEEHGGVRSETALKCSEEAWKRIYDYDRAIQTELGQKPTPLRYGENPHQTGGVEVHADPAIDWDAPLTENALSYNNILDLSAAYGLASDLRELDPEKTGVVIIKHNNPCGVAHVPKKTPSAQKNALIRAWEGDPVSAFGGVLIFTDPLEDETATWLSERFIELVAAPGLQKNASALKILATKRKKLKALEVRRFGDYPKNLEVKVPGGTLFQSPDTGLSDELRSATKKSFPKEKTELARFGIAVARALKSNTIALVREISSEGTWQLVGAGQGQPNRIDALKILAVPRAKEVLKATGGEISDCVMISDAFFPFRDTVDATAEAGIRYIIQPGGSIKDKESIAACDEHGISMALTGIRHFRH